MPRYIFTAAAPRRVGEYVNTGTGTEIELPRGVGDAFVAMHWLIAPEAEALANAVEGADDGATNTESVTLDHEGSQNPENTAAGDVNDTGGGKGSQSPKGRPGPKK